MKNAPRFAIVAAVISLFGVLQQAAQGATDPNLSVTIRRTNQNVILQWFGSNAVPYQVESTSNLTTWANSSLVVTGAGLALSFTNSVAGQTRAFYRVKRLPTAAIPSAVFNPGTGILTVIGTELDNVIIVGRNAAGFIRVNGGGVIITGGTATVTNTILIEVFGRDGHDQLIIDQTDGMMPAAHLFGELGNDFLGGAFAVDDLVGGPGSDTLQGRGSNDRLFGDADDDTFVWNPGDGNDVIEGGVGQDTLTFNGSAGTEIVEASPNGGRLLFTRNVGSVIMDVDDVERVTYNALAGADSTIVNNLTGTDVTEVNVNLAGTAGGTTGDALADVIILNGTAGANTFNIAANAGAVEAGGLGALVRVVNGEGSNDVISIVGVGGDVVNINGSALSDIMTVTAVGSNALATATGFTIPVSMRGALTLRMNGLGGADTISCSGNLAAIVPIILDGGNDNDTLLGSNGIDVILAGAGNDYVDGNQGNDTAFLGGDNDTFIWDPGDGSDTVEGQAGTDLLLFNGSAGAEIVEAFPNGGRLLFTRNVGNVIMDVDDVERVTYNALAGADSAIVNNLTGTDVTEVNVNLAGTAGGTTGDALADVIILNGTAGANTFNIAANAGVVEAGGLGALVRVVNGEGTNDVISIVGVGGDVVNINGSALADVMSVTAAGSNALATATGFTIPVQVRGALTLQMNGLGGADTISCAGNLAAIVPIVLDGGNENDTLLGSNGIDVILGGAGDDHVDGNQGNDIAFLGGDNDTFNWDPGDGSDTVEGQAGTDLLLFNGSGASEIIEASPNGGRLLFTRNVGSVVMDVDDVERVTYNALAGTDTAIINNLTGTDATEVNVNLSGTLGTVTGDALADVIILNGTAVANTFNIAANAGAVEAGGLGALVRVFNGEQAVDFISIFGVGGDVVNINGSALSDIMTVTAVGSNALATATGFNIPVSMRGALTLRMNGLGGADTISCSGNLAAIVPIVLDGGNDNDTLLGSNGIDVILAGAGNDYVDGNQGNDTAFLGGDNDTFNWDPGDGSDTVEGQAGTDLLLFNGSAGAEVIQASPNGGRLLFTRNVGNVIMDVDDVERVTYNALAGADSAIVNNLTGTDVTEVNVNLAGTAGGNTGDAVADVITINGTGAADTFNMTASAGVISVSGLIPLVRISNSEVANDDLVVNGLAGVDVFNIGAGVTTLIGVATNQ